MANGFVQVDPDSTGKKVDTEDLTVGINEVQRQRIIHAPGSEPQGCNIFHQVSESSTNNHSVKASPGQVYGWRIFNNTSYPIYVKLHNTASNPTAGQGVVQTIGVQAGMSDSFFSTTGIAYSTGIGLTIVKGIEDGDQSPIVVDDCVVDLFYH